MIYSHTQEVPCGWLTAFGALGSVAVFKTPGVLKTIYGAALAGALYTFRSLTVCVDEEHIGIEYGGWLGLKTINVCDVDSCQITRTSPISGWGVHFAGDGWLYNVYGLDAVEVRLKSGKKVYIGTDEPNELSAAIDSAVKACSAPMN